MSAENVFANILYLNPGICYELGITSVDEISQYWKHASVEEKQQFIIESNHDTTQMAPSIFFAQNASSSNLNPLAIDRDIRIIRNTYTTSGVYIPNVYRSVVIEGPNKIAIYDAEYWLETNHISSNYNVRILYPSGKTRNVLIESINRQDDVLELHTKESDLLAAYSTDRLNNVILQGIFVADPWRLMSIALANNVSSNLQVRVNTNDFNFQLYKVLYPICQGMSIEEAYTDYIAYYPSRIGSTHDIAISSSNMRTIVPYLEVTGEAIFNSIRFGNQTTSIDKISRDYITEFNFCKDDALVSERAIKTYTDRERDVRMKNAICNNLICRSNLSTSNMACENLVCDGTANFSGVSHASNMVATHFNVTDIFQSEALNIFKSPGSMKVECPAVFSCNMQASEFSVSNCVVNDMLHVFNCAFSNVEVYDNITCECDLTVLQNSWVTGTSTCSILDAEMIRASSHIQCERVITNNVFSSIGVFSNVVINNDINVIGNIINTKGTLTGDSIVANTCDVGSLYISSNLSCDSVQCVNISSDNSAAKSLLSYEIDCVNTLHSARVESSNILCSNLHAGTAFINKAYVDGDVRISGSMAVGGYFMFPPNTYFENSNVKTSRLLVTDTASIRELSTATLDGFVLGVKKNPNISPSSSSQRKLRTKQQSFRNIMSIDTEKVGRGDLSYDVQAIRECVQVIQQLIKTHDVIYKLYD